MKHRTLGPYTVSAIGLGAMPVSMNRDGVFPERDEAIAMVHAALDAGVTFIDTADIYAPDHEEMGHNELIVRDALASWGGNADDIVVATKGGITRREDGSMGRDGSLEYLRSAVEKSLRNLGVDTIDLYQYHRPDRWMVYGDIMQNLKTLRDEGKVRAVGISNASVEEIEIAQQVLGDGGLVSVQNEFSPKHPGSFDELTYCGEQGVAFLPWSPLGGTGGGARDVGERFAVFADIARGRDVSPQQVVLAWELSLGDHVIPIPGARRPQSITDSAKAADLELTADELSRCSSAVGLDTAQ
ncbi:aldo/keto reductase [Microbacterium aquimaris]|uniref:aldo/keto reductase n=1 Tax=Microbacterium aquimaris TaxID=459816 RepID=UPI002AD3BA5E|nr:aldo/keto reductase [Microbacterium aquimaris]MDZ8275700.1 aldo/keto reductase [Microbacterium aquimaris]